MKLTAKLKPIFRWKSKIKLSKGSLHSRPERAVTRNKARIPGSLLLILSRRSGEEDQPDQQVNKNNPSSMLTSRCSMCSVAFYCFSYCWQSVPFVRPGSSRNVHTCFAPYPSWKPLPTSDSLLRASTEPKVKIKTKELGYSLSKLARWMSLP